MFKATEKEVKELRREYPKGTRVVLVRMDDTQAVFSWLGIMGVV